MTATDAAPPGQEAPSVRVFSPDELREDLAFLVESIRVIHPQPEIIPLIASPAAQASAAASFQRPQTRLAFCRRVAPLVNQSPDGHTFLTIPYEELRHWSDGGGRLFPWDLSLRSEPAERNSSGAPVAAAGGVRAFIATSYATDAELPSGTEVLAVNGISVPQLVTSLLPYPQGETLIRRLVSLRYGFRGMLWSVAGMEGPYVLTLAAPGAGSRAKHVTHPGLTEAELQARRQAAGQSAKVSYRYSSWPEDGVGLIDFRDFDDPVRFEGFLKETFARIREERVRALIVDLRRNDGGDSRLGDLLLEYLVDRPVTQFRLRHVKVSAQIKALYLGPQAEGRRGDLHYQEILAAPDGTLLSRPGNEVLPRPEAERFRGQLYLLIGPATYSSAVMLASAVKDHRLGTLVGEETGGTGTQYADMCPVTLPHTQVRALISHKWFLRPSGVDDGRGVLPDVAVPAGEALERARALIAGRAT